jgi:hypothetical protein
VSACAVSRVGHALDAASLIEIRFRNSHEACLSWACRCPI